MVPCRLETHFGADDVHNALTDVEDRNVGDAELLDVLLQRLDLDAAVFLLDVGRGAGADGGDVVVGDSNGQVGPAQLAARETQALEGLRAGDLVQEVAVDVEDAGAVGGGGSRSTIEVAVPDFIKQRAWGWAGHGTWMLLPTGDLDGVVWRKLGWEARRARDMPTQISGVVRRCRVHGRHSNRKGGFLSRRSA